MPLSYVRQFWDRPESAGRLRGVLLWLAVGVGLALLIAYYATLAAIGREPTFLARLGGDAIALLTFGLVAYLLDRHVDLEARDAVPRLLIPLLATVAGMIVTTAFVLASGGPAVIDPATGLPDGLLATIQITGVTALEVVVAFVVLFSLRALMLFRRTPVSGRNWSWMMAMMVLAALVLAGRGPVEMQETFIPHIVLLVIAWLLMVANSFRLAWIAYLPFRHKLRAVGVAFLLIMALVVAIISRTGGGWIGAVIIGGGAYDVPEALAAVISAPVSSFVELTLALGILYGSTALLALLFHLPTARAMQQKSGEMEALQALARLSSDVFDRAKLVETIASAPVEAGVAEAAWIALIEPESGSLKPRLVAARGLTPLQIRSMTDSEALAEAATRQKEPLVLRQAPADHRVHARPGDGIGSLVVLPLQSHDGAHGVLFAARAISHGFEHDDVAALETFASQAALAISSSRLLDQRIEHERAARELAIARDVQRRLLPDTLPCTDRLHCAAVSLPAYEVAGDYYDIIDLGNGRMGFIVADVAGKGTSAAFHMAEMKGVFQSLGRLDTAAASLLTRANEALAQSLYKSAFITAAYAIVDEREGTLTLARAGHCPPILIRRSGDAQLLRPPGLGIGLDRGPKFAASLVEEEYKLQDGDTVLLYTDGIVEARSTTGDEFGYERLVETVQRHRELSPEDLRDAIVEEVRRFSHEAGNGSHQLDDDLTLLIVRWSMTPVDTVDADEQGEPETDLIHA